MMTVPPPSPQDASMLESVFSKHLSLKMHSQASSSSDSSELHARKLNGLLLNCKRRSFHKRPSHIPILSSRIIRKSPKKQDLTLAFERTQGDKKQSLLLTKSLKKKEAMDKIVQELKEMGL
jgi:hypothetical protein